MKSIIIILFVLATAGASRAQSYESIFGTLTTRWSISAYYQDTLMFNGMGQYAYFRVQGDTSCFGKTYKQVIARPDAPPIGPFHRFLLREDRTQGQVWYRELDTTACGRYDTVDHLVFDFSLQVGDSFNLGPYQVWSNTPSPIPYVIAAVDSVYYDSSGRKHVCFGTYSTGIVMEFIEGVGGTRGPMYQRLCWDFSRSRLKCASKDGRYTYQDPNLPTTVRWCDTLGDTVVTPTAIAPRSSTGQLVLAPNPASSVLSLSGITPVDYGSRYQIRNAVGQIVQQGVLPAAASHALRIELLPAGLYYLRLRHTLLPFLKQENL